MKVKFNNIWYKNLSKIEISPYYCHFEYLIGGSFSTSFSISPKEYRDKYPTSAMMNISYKKNYTIVTFISDWGTISGVIEIPNKEKKLIKKLNEYLHSEF
jgi:hypothetical protein